MITTSAQWKNLVNRVHMTDQPEIGSLENVPFPSASIIKGYFFAFPPDTTHTGTIFSLKSGLDGCQPAKGRSNRSQNRDGRIVVDKEEQCPPHTQGARELRGEKDEVQRWFEEVTAVPKSIGRWFRVIRHVL